MGETIERSAAVSRFSKVDLPTLGMADDGHLDFLFGLASFLWRRLVRGIFLLSGLNRHGGEHRIEQVIQAVTVFGGDREYISDSEAVKVSQRSGLLKRVNFVYREKDRFAGPVQQARQLQVGGGEFGAAIDHHDHGGGFIQGDFGLAENLRRNECLIVGDNAAGIDNAQRSSAPFRLGIKPVAGDAGFVADDGAPRSRQPVKERGLANIGPSNNGQSRMALTAVCEEECHEGMRTCLL